MDRHYNAKIRPLGPSYYSSEHDALLRHSGDDDDDDDDDGREDDRQGGRRRRYCDVESERRRGCDSPLCRSGEDGGDGREIYGRIQSMESHIRTGRWILFMIGLGLMIFVVLGCFGILLRPQICQNNDGECSRWRTSKLKISSLSTMESVRPIHPRRPSDNKSEAPRLNSSIDEQGSDQNHPCIIQIVVLYVDVDDGQREMAEYVALGARELDYIGADGNKNDEKKSRVDVNITFITMDDDVRHLADDNYMIQTVLRADAIVLGSPVYNANIHPSLQRWINDNWKISDFWNDYNTDSDVTTKTTTKMRVGGAFVTSGGMTAGAESTLQRLLHTLMTFQVVVVGGHDWTSSLGAAAVTAEAPFGTTKRSSIKNSNQNSDNTSRTHKSSDEMDDKGNEHSSYFPSGCYYEGGQNFGSNPTTSVEEEDATTMPTTSIHPMFLDKAYGLGRRVASVARRLKYGTTYASSCPVDSWKELSTYV